MRFREPPVARRQRDPENALRTVLSRFASTNRTAALLPCSRTERLHIFCRGPVRRVGPSGDISSANIRHYDRVHSTPAMSSACGCSRFNPCRAYHQDIICASPGLAWKACGSTWVELTLLDRTRGGLRLGVDVFSR